MIYETFKTRLFWLIKAPTHPPEPPAGSQGSIETFRAAPNFLRIQLIVWGLGFAGAIVGELIFLGVELFVTRGDDDRTGELALAALLLVITVVGTIIKFFLIRIDYDMRYYVVTDRSLRIREGALLITESTYTFANIQNLKVTQGPLERLLGLSNLIVETAGGASSGDTHGKSASHEGNLKGITNAREVRDQMLVLLKKYRDAGLGDPEDRGKDVPHAPSRDGMGGFSPVAMQRLGEVLDEVRHLGRALG